MFALLLYNLRLAVKSLRRDPGLTAAMIIGLALGTSVWTTGGLHILRTYGPREPLSPDLHQVELPHDGAVVGKLGPGSGFGGGVSTRVRVTYPEYERLAGTGIPARETACLRARVVVTGPDGAARLVFARFVNADFFRMFARPFGWGAPWSAAEERAGEAVVVLGRTLAQRLFGGVAPEGTSEVLIEGRPHRVTGAVSAPQPYLPEWEISAVAMDADALYLPFAAFRALLARPELPVAQSSVGPSFSDLLRSDAVFVSFWMELPTDATRVAYQAHLDAAFSTAAGVGRPALRSLAQWRAAMPAPATPIVFFGSLTGLVLVGAGLTVMRLMLAKGLARRQEIGIHRALGASRIALFCRQLLEAALIALPGAMLGATLSLAYVELWNRRVIDIDIPLRLTPLGFLLGAGPAALVGLLAAVYPAWRAAHFPPTISGVRQ